MSDDFDFDSFLSDLKTDLDDASVSVPTQEIKPAPVQKSKPSPKTSKAQKTVKADCNTAASEKKAEKKPIFKRWWFWAAVVVLVIAGFGGNQGTDAEVSRSATLAAVADTPVPTATPAPTNTPEPTDTPEPTPEPTPTPERIHGRYADTEVYVSNNNIIHSRSNCSNMKYYTTMTLKEADAAGYDYCDKCF